MPANCRPSTRVRYEDLLRQSVLEEVGSKPLDAEWAAAMLAFAAKLSKRGVQYRPHVTLVRTVLRAAVELRVLARMPELPRLPKVGKKLPAAPSDHEIAKLLAGASGWLRLAISLAVYAGLRMGEIRALEVGDVDRVHGRIEVRRALSADEVLSPKSGDDRVIPIATPLRELLEEVIQGQPIGRRVLLNNAGRTPGRQHILMVLKRLEVKLGLRPWSFHALRHYFCTTLLRRGAHAEAVRVLAGHSSLKVTERYLHAAATDLHQAIARLNP
jgi:integrase